MRSVHDQHTPGPRRWRAALLVLPLAGLGLGGAVVAAPGLAGASPTAPAQAATPVAAHVHHATKSVCRKPKPGYAMCDSVVQTDSATPAAAAATPSGYGPGDIQSAYALSGANAAGRTVAIVDAYNLPTAESDLASYRSTYGLPACTKASGCFRQLSQTGTTTLPATDAGWGQEIALDIDMVSAACPTCKILLIEANSSSTANLAAGVNEAVSLGATAVSNSYGGSEASSETSTDSSYNHPGVAITASSGDGGYGVEYPAASKYVTAVGGTNLQRASNARGWSETVWGSAANTNGGAGSGCSKYETKPSFQTDSGCAKRTVADVSAVADPQTGVAVYDSTSNSGQVGWQVFGGTSASSPIIASVYTLAGTVASGVQANTYPYAGKSHLNDVTSGTNGSCGGSYLCTGTVGYDGPTGLGTPAGTAAFAAAGTTPTPTPTPTTAPTTAPPTTAPPTTAPPTTAPPTTAPPTTAPPTTAPPTTSPAPSCTASQLIGNGGFETGTAAPWTASSGVVDKSTGEAAHSGSWKAWLDGYGSAHTDTLSQTFTIPAACKTAALSFYLHIDTAESGSTAYDKLSIQVLNSSGTVLSTLATYSNANAATGFKALTGSLAAYAGQTVTLKFTGTEDSSNATSFVVDDAALNVS